MHICKRLLYLRKKNELSLEQASQGIISLTHLSNIENGRYQPNEDILKMLAKRYGVKEEYLLHYEKKDKEIEEPLRRLLDVIITNGMDEANNIIEMLDSIEYIHNIEQEFVYYVLKACCLIKENKPYEEIMEIINIYINGEEITYPSFVHQSYCYFMSLNNYYVGKYENCYPYIKLILKYDLAEYVHATIEYQLLYLLFLMKKRISTVKQAEKALTLFYGSHLWEYVAKTYNILTVTYLEEHDYESALHYAKKALAICNQFHFNFMKISVFHNLGIIYKAMQNFGEAIKYLTKTIQLKQKHSLSTKESTIALLSIFLALNDKESFDHWYDKVEEIDEELIVLKLKLYDDLIPNYINELKSWGDVFVRKKHYQLACDIYYLLSQYYGKARKYKLSNTYIQKIIEINDLTKDKITISPTFQ